MDIRNIYSSDKTDKEQELQAFIYELKKQLEVLLEENSKLSKKAINFTKLEKLEKLLKDKEFKLNNLENDNILYKDKLNQYEKELISLEEIKKNNVMLSQGQNTLEKNNNKLKKKQLEYTSKIEEQDNEIKNLKDYFRLKRPNEKNIL